MSYFEHLFKNWKVAMEAIFKMKPLMALLHFTHGLIPCKYTSHSYWGIGRHVE